MSLMVPERRPLSNSAVGANESRPRPRLERLRRAGGRWPVLVVAIALGMVKAYGLGEVLHHRAASIALVAVALAARMLKFKPIGVAALSGVPIALLIAPHPLVAGVGVAVAACAGIVTLMLAIATLLRARDRPPPGRA